jgi:hypothetical protein
LEFTPKKPSCPLILCTCNTNRGQHVGSWQCCHPVVRG